MDWSTAGYLTILNLLWLIFGNLTKWEASKSVASAFNVVVICALVVFIVIDSRLYSYWGYHLDSSVLAYLKTPKEAMASANMWDWLMVLISSVVLSFLWVKLFHVMVKKRLVNYDFKIRNVLVMLGLIGVLILPIRGGIDVSTMNVSKVYYSTKPFENHVALNAVWNAMFSLMEGKDDTYDFMEDDQATEAYQSLFSSRFTDSTLQKGTKPNVIVVVLESFTANVVSSIGGIDGITPNLNRWMSKGLSFDHCYASGDRSDKGLTTIFTGFPALPNTRLLSHPNKLMKAPKLYEDFKEAGYHTSFYYGGNIEFANLKLLFSNGSVDRLVTKDQLKGKSTGKWGVRDGEVFHQFYTDLSERESQPFFTTLYSLSSHEPFDIPAVSFTSDSLTSDFYKAVYYTDSCFGVLMDNLQKMSAWENTLVVVTADHGVKNPGDLVALSPRKFRVPLLFTGGFVDQTKRYTHCCSHTDISYTLRQLVKSDGSNPYVFGKSVFDTTSSFALYYYMVGAGMVNEHGCVVYDIQGKEFLVNKTNNDSVYQRMQQQILGVTQYASKVFNQY